MLGEELEHLRPLLIRQLVDVGEEDHVVMLGDGHRSSLRVNSLRRSRTSSAAIRAIFRSASDPDRTSRRSIVRAVSQSTTEEGMRLVARVVTEPA